MDRKAAPAKNKGDGSGGVGPILCSPTGQIEAWFERRLTNRDVSFSCVRDKRMPLGTLADGALKGKLLDGTLKGKGKSS